MQTAAAVTTEAILLREAHDGIVTLTLNRPAQFNALSAELLAALQSALQDLAQDKQARVVILAGAGKAFCPGHDLKQMRANRSKAYTRALLDLCSDVMTRLMRIPQPVIARLQQEIAAAVRHPDVQKRMTDVGAEPSGSTSAEMQDMLRLQVAQVRPVVEELKLLVE